MTWKVDILLVIRQQTSLLFKVISIKSKEKFATHLSESWTYHLLKAYCLPKSKYFHTQNYCRFPYDINKMKIKHRIIDAYATKRCFYDLKKLTIVSYWKLINDALT